MLSVQRMYSQHADMCLCNDRAEKLYEEYDQFRAVIKYDGRVHWEPAGKLTHLTPAVPNCYCLKRQAPYWTNPPVLIFDMALTTERQSARMSKIKTDGLDQYGKV